MLPIMTAAVLAAVNITTVHVIESCHLDVGFANTSQGIINEYFTKHIPNALKTNRELRLAGKPGLQFMAQTYYLSLYLDCPSGMGLVCPSKTEQAEVLQALKDEVITYHAFPHNAELEMASPSIVTEGIKQTHALDDLLGLPHKKTLSQRDVPGLTRAAIPLLLANGVNTISVGVNGGSAYPRVPKLFRWQDISGEEVYAFWHPKGYGNYSKDEAITVDGLSHALVYDWNGDNQGPKSRDAYETDFKRIQAEFPGAEVVPSTFDNFTQHLDAVRDTLPIVTQEIGDSWIYGCPSDPKKVAMISVVNRAWEEYLGKGGERTPGFLNATRLALKGIEHTWGRDRKSNLKDSTTWENADFHTMRVSGVNKTQFQILENSYWEQREWAFAQPLEALKAHGPASLYDAVTKGFAELTPTVPNLSGFTKVDAAGTFALANGMTIGFSNVTGGISTLKLTADSPSIASEANQLLLVNYTSYSQEDYTAFIKDYASMPDPPSYFPQDFGKPGDNVSEHKAWLGSFMGLYQHGSIFVVELRVGADTEAHLKYGAPALVFLTVDASVVGKVSASFGMFNKTSTRLPESMFVMFNPVVDPEDTFSMTKLGETFPVHNDSITWGGSTHLHGVDSVAFANGDIRVSPVDARVVGLGVPSGFPTPEFKAAQIKSFGASSILWNNLWGTNYVMVCVIDL